MLWFHMPAFVEAFITPRFHLYRAQPLTAVIGNNDVCIRYALRSKRSNKLTAK